MATKSLLISFISNIFLTSLKLIFGILSKSKTLIADGVHSLSDTATDIIGIIGTKIANKKPDKNHPYGHGKAEYLTSIFISMIIIYLAYEIFKNSLEPSHQITKWYILLISLLTILVKLIISTYLIKKGKKIGSNILITSGTESRYDSISGAVAFIFILLSLLSNQIKLLKYADSLGSIIISLLTLKIGVTLFIENFKSAMGEVDLDQSKIKEIKNELKKHKEVKNIRRVTILKYGSYSSVIIDIEVSKNLQVKKLYEVETSIKTHLKQIHEEFKYITINVKPYEKKTEKN